MSQVATSPEVITKLVLETLAKGDIITVTCEEQEGGRVTYWYRFEVVEPGDRPTCMLLQTDSNGRKTGPSLVVLEGSGRWTTKEQNPCQEDWNGKMWTIGWGMLHLGETLSVFDREGGTERWELLPACTEIRRETS